MFTVTTIKQGERVAVWNPKGEIRFVDGPQRLILIRDRIEPLMRYSAETHQYLAVRFLDGRTQHLRGPIDLWFNPVVHGSITVETAVPIDAHEALVIYQRRADQSVTHRVLRGPAMYVPESNE